MSTKTHMSIPIPWLPEDNQVPFPPVEEALSEPDGLLAAGGSLQPGRLLMAYRQGIFPWFNEGDPVLWWSPAERAVFTPESLHISRRLRRTLKQEPFEITRNHCFKQVMQACAAPRRDGSNSTWITPSMLMAYVQLHELNYAHSIECWQDDVLVGGLYGVQMGRIFFGESMFSLVSNASKAVLAALFTMTDTDLLDGQISSGHLHRMGAILWPRGEFIEKMTALIKQTASPIDRLPGFNTLF